MRNLAMQPAEMLSKRDKEVMQRAVDAALGALHELEALQEPVSETEIRQTLAGWSAILKSERLTDEQIDIRVQIWCELFAATPARAWREATEMVLRNEAWFPVPAVMEKYLKPLVSHLNNTIAHLHRLLEAREINDDQRLA